MAEGVYDLRTSDFQVSTELVPGTEVTMLQVGDKQYWMLAGNWYDVPQSVQVSPPVTQALSISQYIKEFKKIEKLGDTQIDGEAVYHIRAIPDMKELVKKPGITDLLKDPTGKQIRTVDEIEEMKVVFDFYVLKKNDFFKRSVTLVESTAPNELIQAGVRGTGRQDNAERHRDLQRVQREAESQGAGEDKPPARSPEAVGEIGVRSCTCVSCLCDHLTLKTQVHDLTPITRKSSLPRCTPRGRRTRCRGRRPSRRPSPCRTRAV